MATVIAGFVMAMATTSCSTAQGSGSPHPAQPPEPARPVYSASTYGHNVPPGRFLVFPYLIIRNVGSAPVVLRTVSLVAATPGLTLRAAWVLDTERPQFDPIPLATTRGLGRSDLGVPPRVVHRLPGYVIPVEPGTAANKARSRWGAMVELLLSVPDTAGKNGVARDIAYTYTYRGVTYRRLAGMAVEGCQSRRPDCPFLDGIEPRGPSTAVVISRGS